MAPVAAGELVGHRRADEGAGQQLDHQAQPAAFVGPMQSVGGGRDSSSIIRPSQLPLWEPCGIGGGQCVCGGGQRKQGLRQGQRQGQHQGPDKEDVAIQLVSGIQEVGQAGARLYIHIYRIYTITCSSE